MCYHTSQTKTTSQLESRFKVKRDPEFPIEEDSFTFFHRNGFSHPNLLMVPQERPDLLTPATWGILPVNVTGPERAGYYKESVRYGGGLNARNDKLFSHFNYRTAIHERRCLIPAVGFFEPHHAGKSSYPVYVQAADHSCLALAGIYNVSKDGYVSMAIITIDAKPRLANIHNQKKRQPLILKSEAESAWLSHSLSGPEIQDLLDQTLDEGLLKAWTVSREVFQSRSESDRPGILDPVRYEEIPLDF